MNELFVNVKVDREERPDLDSVYMDAVVALTGHGGWPMTVFLTPGRRAVLRRHVLPARAAARAAELPPGADGGRRRVPRAAATTSARSARELVEAVRARAPSAAVARSRSPPALLASAYAGPARDVRPATGAASAARRSSRPPRRSSSSCGADDDASLRRASTLDAMARGHVRPGRRRLPPLLGGRALARAALREDALRQRAARPRVPACAGP